MSGNLCLSVCFSRLAQIRSDQAREGFIFMIWAYPIHIMCVSSVYEVHIKCISCAYYELDWIRLPTQGCDVCLPIETAVKIDKKIQLHPCTLQSRAQHILYCYWYLIRHLIKVYSGISWRNFFSISRRTSHPWAKRILSLVLQYMYCLLLLFCNIL